MDTYHREVPRARGPWRSLVAQAIRWDQLSIRGYPLVAGKGANESAVTARRTRVGAGAPRQVRHPARPQLLRNCRRLALVHAEIVSSSPRRDGAGLDQQLRLPPGSHTARPSWPSGDFRVGIFNPGYLGSVFLKLVRVLSSCATY